MALMTHEPFDLSVGEIRFVVFRQPDVNWGFEQMAQRKCYVLALALSGKANYRTDSGSFLVEKGDLLFFRKDEVHSASAAPEDPWSFISVGFSLLPIEKNTDPSLSFLPTVTKTAFFSEYADRFHELHKFWDLHDGGSLLKCRSILCDLLYLLIRDTQKAKTPRPHADAIDQIKNLLSENDSRTFHIEELAAMTGLSQSHFRALFKQYTGETVLGFQNRLKIAKACDLLRSGTCNVTEAAYATGFGDIYYFSRLFKKMTGHSPSYYLQK